MLVAALGRNRVIGADGRLPWRLPADLAHFKRLTTGKPIIMGRATYESIGRPLPGRTNIVLTRRSDFAPPGVVVVADAADSLATAAANVRSDNEVCVIGGGQIYQLFMERADRLELTAVDATPAGDTHFPEFDTIEWDLVGSRAMPGPPPFEFQTWVRAQPSAMRNTRASSSTDHEALPTSE